ncbi:N-acyl homoserine lactonase family protein [Sphingopyxis sp. MSC1_008]|jgi:N-acyl homoserine lactone hydrolase|uniref:N-acyl homoserine lactonase family protein n=1 Tax=Sphingopyxis sp. MSC1_008 TaxID=2909265 RepID=UPI0020C0B8B5|nr:N-acyl homoserine lactonase family protein [Sphingopyxis sp. MSC1_008]
MVRTILLGAALLLTTASAVSTPTPKVELWRLDCGSFGPKPLVNSCYLIRHGDRLVLWDAGFPGEWIGLPPSPERRSVVAPTSLTSELARLGIAPDRIDIVAVSHLHWDHIGQAASFPGARLLIGKEDWDAVTVPQPDPRLQPHRFSPWMEERSAVDRITGDRDVFGDGSVVIVATPGHTAGHHSLLVRLRHFGPVMLSGDLYSSAEQYRAKHVSKDNSDPVRTLESFQRFDAMAKALKATVIIQHEPGDVAKLPAFPTAAD